MASNSYFINSRIYAKAGILDRWITAGRFEFASQIIRATARVSSLNSFTRMIAAIYFTTGRVSQFLNNRLRHRPFLNERILSFSENLRLSGTFSTEAQNLHPSRKKIKTTTFSLDYLRVRQKRYGTNYASCNLFEAMATLFFN